MPDRGELKLWAHAGGNKWAVFLRISGDVVLESSVRLGHVDVVEGTDLLIGKPLVSVEAANVSMC